MRRMLTAALAVTSIGLLGAGCSKSGSTVTPIASPLLNATSRSAAAGNWLSYHGDSAHDGYARSMPAVKQARLLKNLKLDGNVYASPIVVNGITIVATENDTVYGFNRNYRQVWKKHLGSPSPSEERQCGDITPLGITGTPVYSPSSHLVYLVTELAGTVRHELIALKPTTGATQWSRSVDLPGVSARDMQQRGALATAHGRVWVSFGAQAGDCGNYTGRVVGMQLDGHGAPVSFTPPTKRGGGIWNPAGPTRGPAGDLLVVSANGAAFPGDRYDHTNSVLRINAKANRVDSFAPSDWAANNQGDVGLGSQGVALVGTKWAVLGGKSGPVYVLRRNHLGGIGGQVSMKNICPSYGGAAVAGGVVYLPCTDGVRAVRVSAKGHLHVLWHVSSSSIQGSPVIGGGRVWALDQSGGVLHALNPENGKTLEQIDVGPTSRFATPAITGRDVLVPTLAGLAVVRTS
jgi:outer membrane protein assembly factor BamB